MSFSLELQCAIAADLQQLLFCGPAVVRLNLGAAGWMRPDCMKLLLQVRTVAAAKQQEHRQQLQETLRGLQQQQEQDSGGGSSSSGVTSEEFVFLLRLPEGEGSIREMLQRKVGVEQTLTAERGEAPIISAQALTAELLQYSTYNAKFEGMFNQVSIAGGHIVLCGVFFCCGICSGHVVRHQNKLDACPQPSGPSAVFVSRLCCWAAAHRAVSLLYCNCILCCASLLQVYTTMSTYMTKQVRPAVPQRSSSRKRKP